MTPRPWRLTRRQRVEMEAALARLRRDVVDSRGGQFLAAAHWIMQAATYVGFRTWEHDYGSGRILRARVAIALRAALRADEDARCEEQLDRVRQTYDAADFERSELRAGAEDWCDALREWAPIRAVPYEWPEGVEPPPSVLTITLPGVGRMVLASRVPLALWEREPSLWAQSPPTSGGPRHG